MVPTLGDESLREAIGLFGAKSGSFSIHLLIPVHWSLSGEHGQTDVLEKRCTVSVWILPAFLRWDLGFRMVFLGTYKSDVFLRLASAGSWKARFREKQAVLERPVSLIASYLG